MPNQPKLSLCMIVKNEEKLLPGCLESAKDFVDEIIVVDTGSTDRTIEIARRYNAKIYIHPWQNDFSKHRNQSISYASGEWILYLDADEELVPPSGEIIRKAIKDNTIDSIAVQIINPFNNGRNQAVFNSIRVFKKHIRFEGIVHNKEVGCKNTKFHPIRILHHGYNLNEQKMTAKFDRTTSLLKKQIEEDPDNPMPHHYLSASYLSMGAYRNDYYGLAIHESTTAIRLASEQQDDDQIYLCTHYIAAASNLNLGNMAVAEAVCKDALGIFSDHLDSYYLLSKIYDQKGDFHLAKICSKRYVKIREQIEKNPARFGKIINNSFWGEGLVKIIQGKSEYELGDRGEARMIFEDLIKKEPGNWEILRHIGEFYLRKGAVNESINYLNKAQEIKKDKLILYMLVECFGQIWDVDSQIRVLSDIIKAFPDEKENFKQIGKVQFERGNYRLASFCLAEVVKMGDRSPEIIDRLEKANSILGEQRQKKDKATNSLPSISACLMAKDEEDCIERCLKSIKPFVDEIILVDTGSTDKTVKIALRYGAKVYHHPWEGDFSKHRNQSISYAKKDWMLIIDADEALEPNSGKEMKKIAHKTSKNALFFKGVNCSSKGEIRSIFGSPRLFKNYVGCHYRGIVHNQPHFPGEPEPTSLKIFHYGYELSPEKMKLKRKRTIELLKKQVEINPNDPFPRFNMAISRFGEGDYHESAKEGKTVIQQIQTYNITDPGYGMIYYIVSMSYYYLDQLYHAEKTAMAGLEYYPENLDALFALTLIYDQKKNYSKTIEYGERFLDLHNKVDTSNMVENLEYKSFGNRWSVFLCMSVAYYKSNCRDMAKRYYEKACNEASKDTFTQKERVTFLTRIGQYDATVGHFRTALGQ